MALERRTTWADHHAMDVDKAARTTVEHALTWAGGAGFASSLGYWYEVDCRPDQPNNAQWVCDRQSRQ
jgi:hypothetical protein